jgi:hypothetical protein
MIVEKTKCNNCGKEWISGSGVYTGNELKFHFSFDEHTDDNFRITEHNKCMDFCNKKCFFKWFNKITKKNEDV